MEQDTDHMYTHLMEMDNVKAVNEKLTLESNSCIVNILQSIVISL